MSNTITPTAPSRVMGGVTVIDTPLVRSALAYARKHASEQIYNHVVRSWLFASVISPQLHRAGDVDQEIMAAALILHDLGWDPTGELVSKDKRFEVDSANAARDFLRNEALEWDEYKLQLVWDSIALHSTASIALYKEPVVAASCMGILADISGPDRAIGGVLTWDIYNQIIAEFPTLGLKDDIKEIFCNFCRTKPETTYDNFLAEFGEKFVEGYSREGKGAVDFMLAPI
ncbi:hypothetical protein V502_00024 [Pseudogymnoascus sp. VKM F-4520 (FW-2644)]|nr:hypothetical protein V502_00024 [Pseudogymnoascus sp. VKM F-4520 (FW-2644)]